MTSVLENLRNVARNLFDFQPAAAAPPPLAGRTCPLTYRYSPAVFSRAAQVNAETIYVIGGIYGNTFALDAILEMAKQEPVAPTLIFNGDFNWFNIDAGSFTRINREVLKHVALRGNVETELAGAADDAGCGCAYPNYVDDADVERSNQIMRQLKTTAAAFPDITAALGELPMFTVASVGRQRYGIVHGDAQSLSGWRFAHDSLHEPVNTQWLNQICLASNLDGFASSHTCLPTFRRFRDENRTHIVINNGAAGMPNFSGTQYGLISRISLHAAREGLAQYGEVVNGAHIDALPVHYDTAAFERQFLANWAEGSPAHHSYFNRIMNGPVYTAPNALGLVRAPSVCA
ncbi:MAG: hypothetical protein ABI905_17835 [Betaproteobacteria bacterium]